MAVSITSAESGDRGEEVRPYEPPTNLGEVFTAAADVSRSIGALIAAAETAPEHLREATLDTLRIVLAGVGDQLRAASIAGFDVRTEVLDGASLYLLGDKAPEGVSAKESVSNSCAQPSWIEVTPPIIDSQVFVAEVGDGRRSGVDFERRLTSGWGLAGDVDEAPLPRDLLEEVGPDDDFISRDTAQSSTGVDLARPSRSEPLPQPEVDSIVELKEQQAENSGLLTHHDIDDSEAAAETADVPGGQDTPEPESDPGTSDDVPDLGPREVGNDQLSSAPKDPAEAIKTNELVPAEILKQMGGNDLITLAQRLSIDTEKYHLIWQLRIHVFLAQRSGQQFAPRDIVAALGLDGLETISADGGSHKIHMFQALMRRDQQGSWVIRDNGHARAERRIWLEPRATTETLPPEPEPGANSGADAPSDPDPSLASDADIEGDSGSGTNDLTGKNHPPTELVQVPEGATLLRSWGLSYIQDGKQVEVYFGSEQLSSLNAREKRIIVLLAENDGPMLFSALLETLGTTLGRRGEASRAFNLSKSLERIAAAFEKAGIVQYWRNQVVKENGSTRREIEILSQVLVTTPDPQGDTTPAVAPAEEETAPPLAEGTTPLRSWGLSYRVQYREVSILYGDQVIGPLNAVDKRIVVLTARFGPLTLAELKDKLGGKLGEDVRGRDKVLRDSLARIAAAFQSVGVIDYWEDVLVVDGDGSNRKISITDSVTPKPEVVPAVVEQRPTSPNQAVRPRVSRGQVPSFDEDDEEPQDGGPQPLITYADTGAGRLMRDVRAYCDGLIDEIPALVTASDVALARKVLSQGRFIGDAELQEDVRERIEVLTTQWEESA